MEEMLAGTLSEREGYWDQLFQTPWDRKVRIHNVSFSTFSKREAKSRSEQNHGASELGGPEGDVMVIDTFGFDIGPANSPCDDAGRPYHGEISKNMNFKVFDSVGGLML